jgi:protein involved in polysaccharide export with SLBB domain
VLLRALALCGSLSLLAPACASAARPLALPAPVELTTLSPGDVFDLRIVREEGLPTAFTVAPDGSVDLPYVGRTQVAGLEPQEVSDAVRRALIEGEILRRPIVTVSVREYTSKRVEVLGEVQHPGSIPLQPGMTLLRAISLSGGFSPMAAKGSVTVRRRVKGKTRAATVSVQDIIENRAEDPLLQAGDSINVDQRFM